MREQCDDCRFYTPRIDMQPNISGICRRYPPVPLPLEKTLEEAFPFVLGNSWCGEFQRPPAPEGE